MTSLPLFKRQVLAWLRQGLAGCVMLLAGLLIGELACAHALPESMVWVDSTAEGMRLTLLMPLNRLEFAFGADLTQAPQQVLNQHSQALAAYVLRPVALRSGGQTWRASPPSCRSRAAMPRPWMA